MAAGTHRFAPDDLDTRPLPRLPGPGESDRAVELSPDRGETVVHVGVAGERDVAELTAGPS